MRVARYPKIIKRKKKIKKVLVETYHCEACGCFVGSEETEEKDFETLKREIVKLLENPPDKMKVIPGFKP
jgi:hypothetical protein